MVHAIDPYLIAEDIRRITSGAGMCFVDVEPHTPNSVMLVNGTTYHVRSTAAVRVDDLASLRGEFGYRTEREMADYIRSKFPRMPEDGSAYVIHVERCTCPNCRNHIGCGGNPEGWTCRHWMRGVES